MARITGFKCDAPKCATTAESNEVPAGWMTVTAHPKPLPRLSDGTPQREQPKSEPFHVCSNRCLKSLASERYQAAVERGDEEGSYYARRKKEAK